MDNKLLFYFLILIQKSGLGNDISSLYEIYGASRLETNEIFHHSVQEGFIIQTDNGFIVTENGRTTIESLKKRLGFKGVDGYIMPYKSCMRPPINTDTVYIPKRK